MIIETECPKCKGQAGLTLAVTDVKVGEEIESAELVYACPNCGQVRDPETMEIID